jgi:hypothetical protein
MEEIVKCPSCFKKLRVVETERTEHMRCPHCQQVFRPDSTQIRAPEAARPPLLPLDQNTRAARREDEFLQTERSNWEAAEDRRPRRWEDRSLLLRRPHNARGLSYATIVLLLVNILIGVGSVPLELSFSRALERLAPDRERAPQDWKNAERLGGILVLIGLGETLLTIAIAVVFLVWLYRSYANLAALGVEGLSYSPGWAVGYFFIPILNLFRPYQVVQEIWKGSDPEYESTNAEAWKNAPGSALVAGWWLFWLMSNIVGQVTMPMHMKPEGGLANLRIASHAAAISAITTFVAGFFLILVVYRITARQAEKSRYFGTQEPDMDSDFER